MEKETGSVNVFVVYNQKEGKYEEFIRAADVSSLTSDLKIAKSHACELATVNTYLRDEMRQVKTERARLERRIKDLENAVQFYQGACGTAEARAERLEYELHCAREQVRCLQEQVASARGTSEGHAEDLEFMADLFGAQDGESVRDAVLRVLSRSASERAAEATAEMLGLRAHPMWAVVKRMVEKGWQ